MLEREDWSERSGGRFLGLLEAGGAWWGLWWVVDGRSVWSLADTELSTEAWSIRR